MPLLAIIKRRLNNLWKRAIVLKVNSASSIQTVQVKHSNTEIEDNIEHFEPYGFTANPHAGSEAIIVSRGGLMNHILALLVPDRRYRLQGLDSGEVAMYDDLGNRVVFRRDRIEVEAVSHLEITAPTCTITATSTHDGNLTINGDLSVNGTIDASGQIDSLAGVSTGSVELGSHTHSGVQSGGSNTGGPN